VQFKIHSGYPYIIDILRYNYSFHACSRIMPNQKNRYIDRVIQQHRGCCDRGSMCLRRTNEWIDPGRPDMKVLHLAHSTAQNKTTLEKSRKTDGGISASFPLHCKTGFVFCNFPVGSSMTPTRQTAMPLISGRDQFVTARSLITACQTMCWFLLFCATSRYPSFSRSIARSMQVIFLSSISVCFKGNKS
jgi:hypothetical protein